jgi:multidrug efflux pump subunit AcrA (membrane-fusion protein)
MVRSIFRKAALNRLASPEQLDQLMPVTSPRLWIALAGFALLLAAALLWGLFGTITSTVDGQGVLLRGNGVQPLPAPCDGVVTSFLTRAGERVEKGEPLAVLTPPGQGPLKVHSPFSGRMLSRNVREGDSVKKGAPLLMLENLDEPLLARLYIPVSEGYRVEANMRAQVWPANVKKDEFGYLKGRVISAARFPITRLELADRLQNEDLARELTAGTPKLQIIVELIADPETISGYQWSSTAGPPLELFSGTPCQGRIIIAEQRPIHLVFPSLGGL